MSAVYAISLINSLGCYEYEDSNLITNLSIKEFRGIKEGRIDFLPITILLGSNNSGKSTLLEALFLAPNPIRSVPYFIPEYSQQYPSAAVEIVYFLHKTLDYRGYAFLLHNYTSKSAELEFETRMQNDVDSTGKHFLRFLKKDQSIYLTSKDTQAINEIRINATEERIPYFSRLDLNQLRYDAQRRDAFTQDTLLISPKLSKAGYEYFRRNWMEITNSGITRRVASDASRLSPEGYTDFTMEPMLGGQLDLHAYLEDGRRIRLGDLGEGIQSYILSRILCELNEPQVILWDDIESHLNPRMLSHIADWFGDLVEEKKQVIISTHSLEATKVIAGINEENTKICITSLRNSILKTKPLTLSEVEKLHKSGIDARTAEALML
jgi:predicted ATP-dependent endonuclease of OLD family